MKPKIIAKIISETRYGKCEGHSDSEVQQAHALVGIVLDPTQECTAQSGWHIDRHCNPSLIVWVEDRAPKAKPKAKPTKTLQMKVAKRADLARPVRVIGQTRRAGRRAQPEPEPEPDYKSLSYNELRTYAKELGIKPIGGMRRKNWEAGVEAWLNSVRAALS